MADMLLSERIRADGITITSEPRPGPPEGESDSGHMSWYDVTLHMDGRTFGLPFGLGMAHADGPQVSDVMSLVTLAVRSVHNNPSFTAWCDDWGFDPDDEQKEIMFRKWQDNTSRFSAFLRDKFLAYMDETQDDI